MCLHANHLWLLHNICHVIQVALSPSPRPSEHEHDAYSGHLPPPAPHPRYPRRLARLVNVLALGVPYLIIYLYLLDERGTRLVRRAVWPLGVMMTFVAGGIRDEVVAPGLKCTLYSLGVFWNGDVAFRYAFLTPYTAFHPLPRPPPVALLAQFRHSRPGQALDLLLGAMRGINLPPDPPLTTAGRSWAKSAMSHQLTAALYLVLYDLLFRPVVVLAPDSFGHPSRRGGDFPMWTHQLARDWGLPWCWWLIWAGLGWVFMCGIMLALHGQYHLTAVPFIAIGYSTDEEWPAPMQRPWLADSLNDLWGKRYHQHLRGTFLLWSTPIRRLVPFQSRAVDIISVLLPSAILHIIMFLPIFNSFKPWPWTIFFLGQAIGMLCERAYYKRTGRKVGGWAGRIWLILWMSVWAGPMIKDVYEAGYVGVARATWTLQPELSGAEWLVRAAGKAVPVIP